MVDDDGIKIGRVRRFNPRSLPKCSYILGYGSAVFKQANNNKHNNMTDLLVITKDVGKFHKDNINMNPSHYTYPFNKIDNTKYLNNITNYGGGVYYNIGIILKPGNIYCKYGIIDHNNLCNELNNWTSLYISGRLQKPIEDVYIYDKNAHNEFIKALHNNRLSALKCGILLILHNKGINTNTISDKSNIIIGNMEDVLISICNLSYMGDIREGIKAEDPNKIYNIVHGQYKELINIYAPLLKECGINNIILDNNNITLNTVLSFNGFYLYNILTSLPVTVNNGVVNNDGIININIMINNIKRLNRCSSIKQGIKGIATSGLSETIHYAKHKLNKGGWKTTTIGNNNKNDND